MGRWAIQWPRSRGKVSASANTAGDNRAHGSQSRIEIRMAVSHVKDPEKTSCAAKAAPRAIHASPLSAAAAWSEREETGRLVGMDMA